MPEEASMSFKVYLDLGGGRQEVRRFGLPETVATNYSVLREKVCSIFGLANQDAVLSWKDSEGDSITISSDDELMEAVADSLSNQNLQLLRINVAVGSGRSEHAPSGSQGNQQGDLHPGVVCDSCNGTVRGFRYRCVTCADYDLCGACETKGLHKEHKMMRLPKPREAGAPWFFWKEREDGPGHYSTHFGMHGGDAGGGFSSSASFSGCGGAAGGAGGTGGWWGGIGGPRGRHCHRRGHGPRTRGGWPGWWGRAWSGRNWAGCGQGQTTGSDSGCQQQQQQQQQQSSSQQSQQQTQQSQSQQQQSNGGCPWVNTEGAACPFMGEESEIPSPEQVAEEAKHMAEQMAQQAHHFATHYTSEHLANVMRGIWTAWSGQQGPNATSSSSSSTSSSSSSSNTHTRSASVSKDDPQQDKSGEKEKREETGESNKSPHSAGEEYLRSVGETVASMLDPLGIDVEVAVEHNGIRQRCSLGENVAPSPHSNSSPTHASPAREPEASAASVASAGSVNMEVQTEGPSGLRTSNNRDDVEAMDVASPAPPASNQGSGEQMDSHSGSPEPEDWTLVNQEIASESSSALGARPKTPPAEKSVSYPSLEELTPHPDPKIQQALEQMSAMGYTNEGGWLTNLLEMKQGDINQVLDLLQPVNK